MELSEVLDEVDWKPWTQNPRRVIHRNEYVAELVDVLHFWINMILVVSGKMSTAEIADEIFTRYALKNRVNALRQTAGYDGRSTKCGGCGRALDDVAIECTRTGDQGYCAKTNADINYIFVDVGGPVSVTLRERENKPIICLHCHQELNEHGCVLATPERWGYCGADQRQLPPIKLPIT
jgi:hypothetical protein